MKFLEKCAKVYEAILRYPGLRQTSIARHCKMSPVDVHRVCRALEKVQWVSVVEGKYYDDLLSRFHKENL